MMNKILLSLAMVVLVVFGQLQNCEANDQATNIEKSSLFYTFQSPTSQIDDIKNSQEFKPMKNNFSFGHQKGDLWIKIIFKPSSDKNLVITPNEGFFKIADLYVPNKEGWEIQKSGLNESLENRKIHASKIAFSIFSSNNKEQILYLHLSTQCNYVGKISIINYQTFFSKIQLKSDTMFAFLLGIFLILIVSNSSLYWLTREKIYLYYMVYTFSGSLYLLTVSNFLIYFNLQHLFYPLFASMGIALASFILFTAEFIQIKKHFPKIYNYLKFLYFPLIFMSFMILFHYQPWNNIINVFSLFVYIFLLIVTLLTLKKQQPEIAIYLIGLIFYCFCLISAILFGLGIFEYNDFTRNAIYLGITIEAVIFQIALAKRHKLMRDQVISTQKEMLDIKTNKEIELTKLVNEKTVSLYSLLKEKELLLREMHHRIKNNFHSLIAILWLEDQRRSAHNNDQIINRLKAMANTHEILSTMDELDEIHFLDYYSKILDNIQIIAQAPININSHIEDFILPFNDAMAIGVIINEIVTNAIKHCIDISNLNIMISFKSHPSKFELIIQDNNINFDTEKFSHGIGSYLIEQFITSLPNGSFKVIYENGCKFSLLFSK